MSVHATIDAPVKPDAPPMSVRKYSVDEYVELQRISEIRHDYIEGEIIPLSGTSLNHNKIAKNITVGFDDAFRNRDCEVFVESIRVRVSAFHYRYPDVIALCGEPLTDNTNPPALLNPSVIVEVLSPSTEELDRGGKFHEYEQISTLTDYVLIAQDHVSVFHYTRHGDGDWRVKKWITLTDILAFSGLEVTLPLSAIYNKVTFPTASDLAPTTSP